MADSSVNVVVELVKDDVDRLEKNDLKPFLGEDTLFIPKLLFFTSK